MKTRTLIAGLTAGAAALVGVVLVPSMAHAEERVCRNATLGAITVDNLRVPAGAWCTLNKTKLIGTAKIERAAALSANSARINGNVQAENARQVNLRSTFVGGSVQIKQGGGAAVTDSRITADIQYDSNRTALSALRNRVGGSIQVMSNRGGVTITSNRVNGNLQCKSNNPAPRGSGNIVQGNKEDQCKRL
ncbi:hypothetical protein [Tenggerimyces flavus]|uniref:DUF3060 domain-containing protein n=1 Tax=Tenggerimyces flavus TaxID=1708749 RepID=A0ABV7YLJ5_9ACTN|nr:hypothetical protein [Tenggerimyces flavus]MBM7784687.1 hypothetical protein [Tenggerimyces flavus]